MKHSPSGPIACVVLFIGVCDFALSEASAAFPSHTFDTNAQGWTIAGSGTDYGPPTSDLGTSVGWDLRGNPGGALQLGDHAYSTWISAPAPFLGNQSDMYGQSFSYDILIRYTDTTSVPYPSAAIRSGALTLLYTIATPPLNVWQTRQVTFNPALWTVGEGIGSQTPGPAATPAQMQSVLSNLERLYLLTEWRTGPDDTSVDNIGAGFNAGLQGDFNRNGIVDAADYGLWRKYLGSIYTQTDYIIWRSHFGETSGILTGIGALQTSEVPEPAALTGLIGLAAIWIRLRWRLAF